MSYTFLSVYKVVFDKVRKDTKKLPIHIIKKLQRWAEQVELLGLPDVKKAMAGMMNLLKAK